MMMNCPMMTGQTQQGGMNCPMMQGQSGSRMERPPLRCFNKFVPLPPTLLLRAEEVIHQ